MLEIFWRLKTLEEERKKIEESHEKFCCVSSRKRLGLKETSSSGLRAVLVLMRERYSPLAVVDFLFFFLLHWSATKKKEFLHFLCGARCFFYLDKSSRQRERESPVLLALRDGLDRHPAWIVCNLLVL